MPHKPGLSPFCVSSISPQILSWMVPLALRAEASQKTRPCCVRRSRTEVTRTMSQRSSPYGISEMGILPRNLFDLGTDAPGKHQRDHFVVSHERPERILERGGFVLLNQEMREPRAAVPGHQSEQEQPPSARRNQIDE